MAATVQMTAAQHLIQLRKDSCAVLGPWAVYMFQIAAKRKLLHQRVCLSSGQPPRARRSVRPNVLPQPRKRPKRSVDALCTLLPRRSLFPSVLLLQGLLRKQGRGADPPDHRLAMFTLCAAFRSRGPAFQVIGHLTVLVVFRSIVDMVRLPGLLFLLSSCAATHTRVRRRG